MTMSNAAMFDLTGKVAVVSGAAGGLGSAICSGLAAAGADIALLDLDAETLATAAAGVEAEGRRALAIEGDAGDEQSVEDAFAQIDKAFGKVDILVNLPFATISGAPQSLTLDDWNAAFRSNVTTYFLCCRQAARRMIDSGNGGAIMNMCSIAGTSALGRGSFPYSVGKGGVAMLTKEMAIEWAHYGIRVNAIQPCQFLTPGLKLAIVARGPRRPDGQVPLRDSAQPPRRAARDGRPGALPRLRRGGDGDRRAAAGGRRQPRIQRRRDEGLTMAKTLPRPER